MQRTQAMAVVWDDGTKDEEQYPGEGAAPITLAVFNPEGARRQLGIGESDFHRVFECIWLEVSKRRTLLDAAFQEGDLKAVALQAHTIKTSAATIGAEALSQAAMAVELAAKAGCLETVARAMNAFHTAKQTLSKLLGMG